jgi:hypothetical protein
MLALLIILSTCRSVSLFAFTNLTRLPIFICRSHRNRGYRTSILLLFYKSILLFKSNMSLFMLIVRKSFLGLNL